MEKGVAHVWTLSSIMFAKKSFFNGDSQWNPTSRWLVPKSIKQSINQSNHIISQNIAVHAGIKRIRNPIKSRTLLQGKKSKPWTILDTPYEKRASIHPPHCGYVNYAEPWLVPMVFFAIKILIPIKLVKKHWIYVIDYVPSCRWLI
jgi:transposase